MRNPNIKKDVFITVKSIGSMSYDSAMTRLIEEKGYDYEKNDYHITYSPAYIPHLYNDDLMSIPEIIQGLQEGMENGATHFTLTTDSDGANVSFYSVEESSIDEKVTKLMNHDTRKKLEKRLKEINKMQEDILEQVRKINSGE